VSTADLGGAFSHPARVALIDAYFGDQEVQAATAWMDVYRLLLWADSTTGLAHCYESDKAQPGRPWYERTLAFHAWLAERFAVPSLDLAEELDWMFRQVIKRVADEEVSKRSKLAERAVEQLGRYAEPMPVPDDDPELRELIEPLLPRDLAARPDDDTVRQVLRRVRAHIANENKRKNLLGRGFEDVLAGVIRRLQDPPPKIGTQTPIQLVDGFRAPREGDKDEKVDLWVGTRSGRRMLVSAKWSVRADREKQMVGDFHTYVACNMVREPFEYYWITNEFDPARLVANATRTEGNQRLFNAVVHVCPEALGVVHRLDEVKPGTTRAQLRDLLVGGRIIGFADWLKGLDI
jgi:hypothetical protein